MTYGTQSQIITYSGVASGGPGGPRTPQSADNFFSSKEYVFILEFALLRRYYTTTSRYLAPQVVLKLTYELLEVIKTTIFLRKGREALASAGMDKGDLPLVRSFALWKFV